MRGERERREVQDVVAGTVGRLDLVEAGGEAAEGEAREVDCLDVGS